MGKDKTGRVYSLFKKHNARLGEQTRKFLHPLRGGNPFAVRLGSHACLNRF